MRRSQPSRTKKINHTIPWMQLFTLDQKRNRSDHLDIPSTQHSPSKGSRRSAKNENQDL